MIQQFCQVRYMHACTITVRTYIVLHVYIFTFIFTKSANPSNGSVSMRKLCVVIAFVLVFAVNVSIDPCHCLIWPRSPLCDYVRLFALVHDECDCVNNVS